MFLTVRVLSCQDTQLGTSVNDLAMDPEELEDEELEEIR